nr:hypothetical protein OG781_15265 [Streptomyces sp. NBC_00830]
MPLLENRRGGDVTLGGYGGTRDQPVERTMRDAKITRRPPTRFSAS